MDLAPLRCGEWTVRACVQGHARVASAERATAKTGNAYIKFTFMDSEGVRFGARQFDCLEDPPSVGAVLLLDGTVDDFNGPLSLIIRTWRIDTSVPVEHFLPRMPDERRAGVDDLDALITGITDEPLRALVEAVFEPDVRARFAVYPAAKTNHGAAAGGLVTHTVRVTQIALALAAFVPAIEQDILLAAALLHDIGKLDELADEPGADLTERGKLLGHVTLGLLKVQDVAATIPGLTGERRDMLLHVIQAAHGKKEWGAPMVPSTFEALLLTLADHAESTIEIGLEAVERTQPGARWTPYVKKLGTWFRVPESLEMADHQTAGFDPWPDEDEVPF